MMQIGKHRIKNHMSLEYDFAGIRLLNGSLVPVDWHISADLVAMDKKGKLSVEELEYNATVAYQKLFFWLDTNLPNIVIVDVNSPEDLYIANLSANIMMYCPTAPYDDVIVQLLHSKLSVLADNSLYVGDLRIKASDMTVRYTYSLADTGYSMPKTTEEYYPEGKTRDAIPWWSRNDGFSFEFVKPEETELSDEELYGDIIDPMTEFYKIIADATEENTLGTKEPARIVQVEKWKPKKI